MTPSLPGRWLIIWILSSPNRLIPSKMMADPVRCQSHRPPISKTIKNTSIHSMATEMPSHPNGKSIPHVTTQHVLNTTKREHGNVGSTSLVRRLRRLTLMNLELHIYEE